MKKYLTYEEFIALAKENYCNGGMVFVECWEKYQFEDYVEIFGGITKTEAMRMFDRENQRIFQNVRL